jgi:hypothetical protein
MGCLSPARALGDGFFFELARPAAVVRGFTAPKALRKVAKGGFNGLEVLRGAFGTHLMG